MKFLYQRWKILGLWSKESDTFKGYVTFGVDGEKRQCYFVEAVDRDSWIKEVTFLLSRVGIPFPPSPHLTEDCVASTQGIR